MHLDVACQHLLTDGKGWTGDMDCSLVRYDSNVADGGLVGVPVISILGVARIGLLSMRQEQ